MSTLDAYRRRRAEREAARDRERRLSVRISAARLLSFVVAAVCTGLAAFDTAPTTWPAVAAGLLFVGLILWHGRVVARQARAQRGVRFYADGEARCESRTPERETTGEALRDDDHPYSGDLDLYGPGSLYARLCAARTSAGQRRLADWLSAPAVPDEISRRQAATVELIDEVDLREELSCRGEEDAAGIHPEAIAEWCRTPRRLSGRWPRVVAVLLSAAVIGGLVAWGNGQGPIPFLVMGWIAVGFAAIWSRRVHAVLGEIGRVEEELRLLVHLLEVIESGDAGGPALDALRRRLDDGGRPPSRRLVHLSRLVQLTDSRRNMIFAGPSLLCFCGTHLAFALEAWRAAHGEAVQRWLDVVAEVEVLAGFAAFAAEHPAARHPEVVDGSRVLEGQGLRHPLLSFDACVPNDVSIAAPLQLLLISGSNMSGKSTYMRTVGTNVVLALAGAPVCAETFRLSPWQVGAAMRISDSLQQGISHFYAEIRRLKRVVDLGDGELPLLFLLDEILHGTNSHDRRLGAEGVIRTLLARDACGMVTTHDLALAEIAESLAPRARNVHFADDVHDGAMAFDYRLREGVVQRSNALELMRGVGLDV